MKNKKKPVRNKTQRTDGTWFWSGRALTQLFADGLEKIIFMAAVRWATRKHSKNDNPSVLMVHELARLGCWHSQSLTDAIKMQTTSGETPKVARYDKGENYELFDL